MKRYLRFLFLAFVLSLFASSNAFALNVQTVGSKTNSCGGANVNVVHYFTGGSTNVTKFLFDEFYSSSQQAISDPGTSIDIWSSDSNLLSGCTTSSDWKRVSSYAPGGNTKVIALGGNCTFSKPTNKNHRTLQFVYKVGYFDIIPGANSWNFVYYLNVNEVKNKTPHNVPLSNVNVGGLKVHANECFNVELRYCGDGILEPGNGETCDPEDSTHTGWGNGGCHPVTCTPVETPTCNGLTMNPVSGIAPVNSVATCSGYKVSTYKIDCGNGQIFNGTGNNSGNQTFNHTCNYTTPGTYTPICTINGSITNTTCQKSVTITSPTPAITIDKRDANPLDKDGNVGGNDSQKVNSGDKAVFKIRVTNSGNENLTSLKLTDTVAPTCAGNVTLPGTYPATWSAFVMGGAGNHANTVLEPGEYFEYKCEKPNTTVNYTNTADVEGTGVISGIKVTDTDPTQVIIDTTITPSIDVDKRDQNPADIDGNIGNDTQTVATGADAVFKITVTNNGPEALNTIVLTDAVEPSCGGSVTLPSTYPATWSSFNHVGNADNKLDPGETFTYTCKKTNTTVGYTNTVIVSGKGVTSGITVTDNDPTVVLVAPPVPAITIDKVDANVLDKDGNVGNDTQSVNTGDKAVFKIKVTNSGTEVLNSLVLTDAVAPNCGGNVTLPSTYPATWSNFTQGGLGNHTNATLEVGETFEYTCEKPNSTTNYTNIAKVCGKGITSTTEVCDEDPTDVKVGQIYDLALTKKIQGTSTTFANGSAVTFVISVFNQGEIAANNVVITDYIPTGLTLNDAAWTQAGSVATRNIGSIAVGASKDVTITFIVNAASGTTIINWSEISSDDGDDVDSTPDQNNNNDCHGGLPRTQIDPASDNRTNGKGDINNNGTCESGEDEDDHDPAQITVGGTTGPAISIDKRDQNSADLDGTVGNDSQKVNRGEKAVFKIKVTNSGTEALNTLVLTDAVEPLCAGSVTLPGTFPSSWTSFAQGGAGDHTNAVLDIGEYFEYVCEKANTQNDYTNTADVSGKGVTSGTTVTATDPTQVVLNGGSGSSSSSSSSSSSGGSGPSCSKIVADSKSSTGSTFDVNIKCLGNTKAMRFKLDCGNGQVLEGPYERVDGWPSNGFIGTCSYTSGVKSTYNPKCYVGSSGSTPNISSLACSTKITLGGPTKCGDGVLQRPNSDGQEEQCERRLNADGSVGPFPDFCTSACRVRISTTPNSLTVITIPNEGTISFGPKDSVIIGNNMNPFDAAGQQPYIRNDSSYDLAFDEFCVVKKDGNGSLAGSTPQCKTIASLTTDGIIYPGAKILFGAMPNFVGHVAGIPTGQSYSDNTLVTTIKNDGTLYDWAYFATKLKVRVSKPSVATTGGGTSYVKNTQNVANITKVADGVDFVNKTENKNFVGTSVADDLSSYTKENVSPTIKQKVEDEGESFEDGLDQVASASTGIGSKYSVDAVTTKYNGIDNVYILKSGENLELSGLPTYNSTLTDGSAFKGPRTYIIEGGDLNITGDLVYDDNIAFVVKGGNINISNDVKVLNGIYIAIPKSGVGGKIQGKAGPSTNNILTVYGSLYGKIESLLNQRTYVKNSQGGQITVGTIVSFASGLFRKPAPLVSEFIQEYLESEKVAK